MIILLHKVVQLSGEINVIFSLKESINLDSFFYILKINNLYILFFLIFY